MNKQQLKDLITFQGALTELEFDIKRTPDDTKNASYKRMLIRDLEDLTSVYNDWYEKRYVSANRLVGKLDTAVRDMIPTRIYNEIIAKGS